jgi:hypothetical protein
VPKKQWREFTVTSLQFPPIKYTAGGEERIIIIAILLLLSSSSSSSQRDGHIDIPASAA